VTGTLCVILVFNHTHVDNHSLTRSNAQAPEEHIAIRNIPIAAPAEPTLHIMSYRNSYKCSEHTPKKGGGCSNVARFFCDCLRVNLQILTRPIAYLGDNEQDEYINGHVKKILDVYQYLTHFAQQFSIDEQQHSIIVMFVDAFDTVFQRNESYILQRFLELKNKPNMQHKVIWQVERECSPGHPRNIDRSIYCDANTTAYPPQPANSDARWLNAGGYIGYLYDVLANFRQFIDFIEVTGGHDAKGEWRGDQEIISMHFINRSEHMTLDYYSYLMQAMNKMYGVMRLHDDGWYNPNMRNYPALLHFNGNKEHIVEYVDKLANTLLRDRPHQGKVNGDIEVELINYNVSRMLKYRDLCGQFQQWYY